MVRPSVLALVLLVAGCARMAAVPPSSLGPVTLAGGEHPERWVPNVVQTSDAADGDHAIAVDLAPAPTSPICCLMTQVSASPMPRF